MKNVVIAGAGASGLLAALTAAEERDNKVVLLERQSRAGKKLSATGNGRCNLTNTGAEERNYHGEEPGFVSPALEAFPPREVVAYFKSLGLFTVEEYGGRVYPLSNSANSVTDTLRFALAAAGVELRADSPVLSVTRRGEGFAVTTPEGDIRADALIIACGGMAGEKLGGVKDGYGLLSSLGHSRTALRPSLVQVTTEPDYPRALKGIRADCRIAVLRERECLAESEGEVLFTDTGVSGPAAFDISRAVSTAGDARLMLRLDLMREYSKEALTSALELRRKIMPALPVGDILTGALHNRLGRMVVKYAGLPAMEPISELSDSELEKLAHALKSFTLPVRGVEGFASAQVTAGGIRTSEFDSRTMQSRLVPNLYACGEVLDVDGDCGGYNLQWAWASGRLAGRLLK